MLNISLRDANHGDEPFLRELFEIVRSAEFRYLPLPEPQKSQLIDLQFMAQRSQYQSAFPNAEYNVILVDGKPAGSLIVDDGDAMHLIEISVLPACQNQGIGTYLIEQLKRRAAAAGKPMALHVERSNGAKRLYERLGFYEIAIEGIYVAMRWNAS